MPLKELKQPTKRLILAYEYLKEKGLVKNQSQFGMSVGAPSLISDANSKNRDVTIEQLSNAVRVYG